MITVNAKLALWLFVFPMSLLIIADSLGFLIFGKLYIDVIAIFTSNWIFLLVWERLRDSLSKKMEYLHDTFFFQLYSDTKMYDQNYINSYFLWGNKGNAIEDKINDLKTHASFMGIKLFPKKLFSKFQQLNKNAIALSECADNLTELITKKAGKQCDKFHALHYLGFDTSIPQSSSNEQSLNQNFIYDNLVFYKAAEEIKKEKPELVNETKRLLDDITMTKNNALTELEYFLKCNNLRLTPKT